MLLSSCLPGQWLGGLTPRQGAGGCTGLNEILEGDDASQEAAVLGPDLGDGLPPAPGTGRQSSQQA